MIEIKEVTTKAGMKDFVKFPFSIYNSSPYWVPPIINDEVANKPQRNACNIFCLFVKQI